ncbi:RebB family R body protein [Pseudomonas sp. B2M1-30]|uniref:RebB family R body protein n=1 Tax=Pseudomonas TaxID=286 RepID=UPI001C3DE796|nr:MULTISPECIES: RebB family R body protein [Pseudomonas]MBV4476606.1 RebB family R body protein [Pseudomonas botevensis]MCU0118440.1 RebB family R body protein [Pseudomonas sp. B2M1-30]MCU7259522.1 RebB family R body protein [Pseudomonas koreensis]
MATVNDQITDAVTQTSVKVVAEAPALAMGSLYQSMAHSTGLMFENAVNAQQQQNVLAQAATNQGVMQIYSVDTAAEAVAAQKILEDSAAKTAKS